MKNLKNALLLKQLYQLKNMGYYYTSIIPYKESEDNLMLPHNLESLEKQACECHLCPLSKSREKVVFGAGNPQAEIMFVGNTPSSSDDSMGKIFTGRVGELLDKMIENVLGLSTKDVYYSNILKCRSQENQTLLESNAHTCLPYLQKEISLIKPKIVVALGEDAYHYLTNDKSPIEETRGMIHPQDGYLLISTYHPSYILRNPSIKKEVFEDLKKIKELYD